MRRKSVAPSPRNRSPPPRSWPGHTIASESVSPETRIVPAIAVPSDEPRFDTLRDRPEISPCWFSGNADWTTFTDGVSITPETRADEQ